MKQNLFRGKCIEDNNVIYKKSDWVFGNLLDNYGNTNEVFINPKGTKDIIKIDPNTVSQFVANSFLGGEMYFEGDILARELDDDVLQDIADGFYQDEYDDALKGLIIYDDYDCEFYILCDDYMYRMIDVHKFHHYSNKWDDPDLAEKILNR